MEYTNGWYPVAGYEGLYEVSAMGRVKSLLTGIVYPIEGRPHGKGGYPTINLVSRDGKKKTVYIHRLVALAFVPGYREGLEVNHKDGRQNDCSAANLEWVTHSQNVMHGHFMKRYRLKDRPSISALNIPRKEA